MSVLPIACRNVRCRQYLMQLQKPQTLPAAATPAAAAAAAATTAAATTTATTEPSHRQLSVAGPRGDVKHRPGSRTLLCQVLMSSEGVHLVGLDGTSEGTRLVTTPWQRGDEERALKTGAPQAVPLTPPSTCESLALLVAKYASKSCNNVVCKLNTENEVMKRASQGAGWR